MNDDIESTQMRVIGHEGEMLGVLSRQMALDKAYNLGLDLVEISPDAKPPVCKIIDYGKFKYEKQKKQHEQRKKQKTVELKELKIRPSIDSHDLGIKLKQARKFLTNGDKVKFTVRFRGREMAHQHIAIDLLKKVELDLEEFSKLEFAPKLEGRQMLMILGPLTAKI